jgi:hypothetical protein
MKNLSDHADLPCELITSVLIRGVQMGEMSKLGLLIGMVKHAICADSLVSYTCCSRGFSFYSIDGASGRQKKNGFTA